MKMKTATSRKLRYGGVTAILTALIIAAIIVVNVIFSALAGKFLWYADMTPELLFTLSDNCIDLIRNGDESFESSVSPIETIDALRAERRAADPNFKDEDLMIRLIFCNEPDVWEESTSYRYIYETAKQLQAEFPDYIRVENPNILKNPSAVSMFEGVSTTSQIIIEFDGKYRVRSVQNFYQYNDDTYTDPWAYNGEKVFASSILSVTRSTASSVACLISNHDELPTEDFWQTLETAGFEVQALNLAALPPEDYEGDPADYNPIPENCRLIVVFDPRADFMIADGVSEINEIERLDDFLTGELTGIKGSMMVFMSADQQTRLNNFEDYLEEWGIVFDRDAATQAPKTVIDQSQSLDYSLGSTIKAEYVKQGAGGELTNALWEGISSPRPMIFKEAISMSYADTFTVTNYTDSEDSSISYDFASGGANGAIRSVYDVFVSSSSAEAWVGGTAVERATAQNPLKLMMISIETETTQEDNLGNAVNNGSYVLACGSPEFASQAVLQNTAYGNSYFLESSFRTIGKEMVPVNLTFKPFGDTTIDTITTAEATQYTVVLVVLPVVLAIGSGIFVLVRRKNR